MYSMRRVCVTIESIKIHNDQQPGHRRQGRVTNQGNAGGVAMGVAMGVASSARKFILKI